MPKYAYKAKEGPDKIVDGFIESENMDKAVLKITQLGLTPIDVAQATEEELENRPKFKKTFLFSFKRISLSDIVIFTRQMSDLIDASVPLLRALQITSKQTQNQQLKSLIDQMYYFVQDGGSFSGALAQHKTTFSSLYVNMVKTGEVGGKLEVVLTRLADYLEKEQDTRNKVRSSLAYPAFIMAVGVLTIFVLLSFVIPRLSVMFDDLDQALPLPTIVLVNLSGFFAQYWWAILGLLTAAGLYLKQLLNTDKGRLWFDNFKLKVPYLGNFIKIVEVGRLSRTLATLIESGVVITTALQSVWMTIDNVVLREEIKNVSEDVASGASLQKALQKCFFFPEVASNMISVGEETGRLDRGLYKIASTFERQSDQIVKTMISLLGPVVLVIIVSIVGFVVIAMLLPIFRMNLLIQ